jgi:hypothetical protein
MSGHTGPRTNASVLRYDVGVIVSLFRLEGGVYVFHPELVTPSVASDMGNLAGALQDADFKQWGAIGYPSGPDEPNPGPGLTPDPGDPLARVKSAPSQWAKWFNLSDAEAQALIDAGILTRAQKAYGNNWWFQNGVKGRYSATSNQYVYYTYPAGVETPNIDTGGADAATELASGQKIPGPALP